MPPQKRLALVASSRLAWCMKVSVLVPVYNGEKYLAECLESILIQDFGDFELLISDNASTDGVPDIINRYARQDSRICWWRNAENLGAVNNFRLCLQKARGDFVKFICGDDKLLTPSAIGKMSALLSKDNSVSLVSSSSMVIDSESKVVATRRLLSHDAVVGGHQAIVSCFERNENIIGEPSGAMFRRSQAGHWFHGRCRQLIDLEQWFALLESGDWGYLAEPLFAFRQHPQQGTNVNRQQGVGHLDQLHLVLDYWKKPWMPKAVTQRMLFVQSRFLRQKFGPEAEGIVSEMKQKIQPAAYGYYWLERKALRPFKDVKKLTAKMGRSLRNGVFS